MNTETQSNDGHRGDDAVRSTRSPAGRLQPDDAAERAGTRPEPAVSVPSANDQLAGRDRDRRARARAAGDELGDDRVAARAVVRRPGADQAGGELVEVGLAREDRAGVEQLLRRAGAERSGRVRERRGTRRWWARRRRRCCPSPRSVTPARREVARHRGGRRPSIRSLAATAARDPRLIHRSTTTDERRIRRRPASPASLTIRSHGAADRAAHPRLRLHRLERDDRVAGRDPRRLR